MIRNYRRFLEIKNLKDAINDLYKDVEILKKKHQEALKWIEAHCVQSALKKVWPLWPCDKASLERGFKKYLEANNSERKRSWLWQLLHW